MTQYIGLKLNLGFDIVGELIKESDDSFHVNNVFAILVRQKEDGSTAISLQEFQEFSDPSDEENFRALKSAVVFAYKPAPQIIAEIRRATSGLILPPHSL